MGQSCIVCGISSAGYNVLKRYLGEVSCWTPGCSQLDHVLCGTPVDKDKSRTVPSLQPMFLFLCIVSCSHLLSIGVMSDLMMLAAGLEPSMQLRQSRFSQRSYGFRHTMATMTANISQASMESVRVYARTTMCTERPGSYTSG